MKIDTTGFWVGDAHDLHKHDEPLCNEICKVLIEKDVKTLLDLGCGNGLYVKYFEENNISCDCCDGNPITEEITNRKCFVQNLAHPFDLKKTYDCVLSLEVGEHLPEEYETTFIENIIRHAKNFIILSWALPFQGGHGHFNEKTNEYVADLFKQRGFERDLDLEIRLRNNSHWGWFQHTIMVFYYEN